MSGSVPARASGSKSGTTTFTLINEQNLKPNHPLCAAANKRKHDARTSDKAKVKPSLARHKVLAPLFLPRIGMCAPPQENESFDSGVAHSFDSGKNNGVLTPNVRRNA